jgi:hypothetical protein
MIECLAITLGKEVQLVEWVVQNDPIKMLQYVEKAKRNVRREKARLLARARNETMLIEGSKIEVKEEIEPELLPEIEPEMVPM